MKIYSVYFKEPVTLTYLGRKFNKETGKWEDVECTMTADSFEFHSLKTAKALIKANLSKYAGSSITKVWANGDWENLGEINLKGSNKTFVANTRQIIPNY